MIPKTRHQLVCLARLYRPIAIAQLLIGCWLIPAGCMRQPNASVERQVPQYAVEQFLNTTTFSGSSFSPDEKSILFSSNKSGIFNV